MIFKLLEAQIDFLEKLQLKHALNIEGLIKRAVSRQDFADFYGLDALSPYFEGTAKLPENMSEEHKAKLKNLLLRRNKLVWDIANYYAQGMRRAIIGEIHTMSWQWPYGDDAKKLKEAGFSDSTAISRARNFTPEQMIACFKYLDWNSQYGGRPWENIAILYKELLEQMKLLKNYIGDHDVVRWHMDGTFKQRLKALITLIDRIHQAEHNTGSLFTHFQDGISSWIQEALNEKAIPSSIQKLKEKAAPDVAEMLEEVYKDEPYADEIEIGSQLAEVQMNRETKKQLDQIEKKYKQTVKSLESELKSGWIDQYTYNRKLTNAKQDYQWELQQYSPGSQKALQNLLHSGKVPFSYVLAYIFKKNDPRMLQQFLKNNRYDIDLWIVNPDIFKQIASRSDSDGRFNLLYFLGNKAKDALTLQQYNEEVLRIVYGMLSHMSPKKMADIPGLRYILAMFKVSGYDMSRFKNIETVMKQKPDEWQFDLAGQEEQLEMFAAKRFNRLKKLGDFIE